jgi:two-component system, chemotaxis family, protein-glutamate methylesterase/glutaminase
MNANPVRAVVVDDSAFMRIAIRQMLEADGVQIVGEGRNGDEAIELARRLKPDIMTLDIIMPGTDGMAALKTVVAEHLCPVIMVSTETRDGARATIRALDIGAVDVVAKGTDLADLDMAWIEKSLVAKVRYWARQNVSQPSKAPAKAAENVRRGLVVLKERPDLVVVAASTGGPRALTELVTGLDPHGPAMIIAQHMPTGFTRDFANHLSTRAGRPVVEAEHGMLVTEGMVAILPGGVDSKLAREHDGRLRVVAAKGGDQPVHPWADLLFQSALACAERPVAVVLTGMGEDGAKGARAFADRGLPVLVQSPESCVVDGMPKAAIKNGAASEVLTVAGIVRRLKAWTAAPERAVPT